MSTPHVVGLDIGSTFVKGIVLDDGGAQVAIARSETPWYSLPHGRTEMDAATLMASVRDILDDLTDQLVTRVLDARIVAVGVSGMAEAGVLLPVDAGSGTDASRSSSAAPSSAAPSSMADNVVRPVVAWFDPRGDAALGRVSAAVAEAFPGRTGLPLTTLATFAKLLTYHDEGLDLTGLQWLSVPEFVAHALGGERHSEISLLARTGLIDQDTAEPWVEALAELGVDASFLPAPLAAGSSWGAVGDEAPDPLAGATLTVAGHDHLVASVAAGAVEPHQQYDSMGTAEALVRVLDRPLDAAARARLAGHGVDVLRHMLPGRSVLLAGTRSGLLMRRVLQLVGVHDVDGRARLDEDVMALGEPPDGLSVTGADNAEGFLAIRAEADGMSPAALFAVTLRHTTELLLEVVAHMDAEVPPASSTVIAGGWADMACVRRARAEALPDVTFSDHQEDTAYGAAIVAAFAADESAADLTDFAAGFCAITPTTERGSS